MVRIATTFVSIALLFTLTACGGSTSFGRDLQSVTIAPGGSGTVTMTLEAEGSHAGTYTFSTEIQSGDGITATVEPASADVDGTFDITVTINVAASSTADRGSVFVSADSGDNSAGQSITVTIP